MCVSSLYRAPFVQWLRVPRASDCRYRYYLITVMVQSQVGIGLPVAYAIASAENAAVFSTVLASLVHTSGGIVPDFVMTDNSKAETLGIASTFDSSVRHILCIFHSNTALLRATRGVGALEQRERDLLYRDCVHVGSSPSERAYRRNVDIFKQKYAEPKFKAFLAYFQENYLANHKKWATAFREEHHANTNNFVEGK